jgi:hypothetical protein
MEIQGIEEIRTDDYRIWYDPETKRVMCQGSLRLSGMDEYAPIMELLNTVLQRDKPKIILNLQRLDFLNSSGISMLSKFVINVRQQGKIEMIIEGSQTIPWQGKSLKNLLRLMPALTLELS